MTNFSSKRAKIAALLAFCINGYLEAAILLPAQKQEKLPPPSFRLQISEAKSEGPEYRGVHRIRIIYTHVSETVELEQVYPEAENMYELEVSRDGQPVEVRSAWLALERFRKAQGWPTLDNPRLLHKGESWVSNLDVSDYFDMSAKGEYKVAVSRKTRPLDPTFSGEVRSNTINIRVEEDTSSIPPVSVAGDPGFILTISAEHDSSGFDGFLRIERENTSDVVVNEAKCWPLTGMYQFEVFRNGLPVAPNEEWDKYRARWSAAQCPGNETLIRIKPKEADVEGVWVSNYFDLSVPGTYLIYAIRDNNPWNERRNVKVISNGFSFTVQPEPPDSSPNSDQ